MADPSEPEEPQESEERTALLGKLRDDLDAERTQLAAQLEDFDEAADTPDFDENFADSGQVAAEQGESRVLAGQLRDQLDDVESALARLEDGTYGSCEVCGQPIGDARLEAMPATRWCIEHAG